SSSATILFIFLIPLFLSISLLIPVTQAVSFGLYLFGRPDYHPSSPPQISADEFLSISCQRPPFSSTRNTFQGSCRRPSAPPPVWPARPRHRYRTFPDNIVFP